MGNHRQIFVVHVIHHLVIGGLENGVVNLINQMPRDRFQHAIICIENFSEFCIRIQDPDVKIYSMHRSKIGAARMRWRLFLLLRKLRPDIVHSRNLSGLDALLPARLAGVATLHSEHGFDVDNLDGRARKPALLRRFHIPFVNHYIMVSEHLRALHIEMLGIESSKITQIYNGVDTARFTPTPVRRHDLLPSELRGRNLFVVGTVGRVQPVKDQATLLRALAEICIRHPMWRLRIRLTLVGDGPLLSELQKLANFLGIADLVWFAGSRNDIADLLQVMDLFVLPSLSEGISNTLLEAMATGIPVLATAVGGNVELLDPGVTGDLFKPGDIDQLATAMEHYIENPALCLAHGVAARQRVLRKFSLQTMVTAYQNVYQSL